VCALTFCLFSTTKVGERKDIFSGVLGSFTLQRKEEMRKNTPAARGERENGGGRERQRGERRTIEA
jgi:hypothetical protein